ncbi:hypothetical protein [Desulfosporosinus sp. Sb-LF]|uniref:hypothetical protein n=1 Tax=Desulfosporosinus sp. Sb-LF TaxID=2560027 RepID=UPI0013054246|nr:hypothetical protein [Desulfosporosinus sp. Sb-LF]
MRLNGALLLSKGKNCWDLAQAVDANSFSFKLVNPHGFTTKDTRLELFSWARGPIKGNNNSLMNWLL